MERDPKEIRFVVKNYIISKRAKHLQTGSFEHAFQFLLGSINIVPSEMYSSRIKEAFELMKDEMQRILLFLPWRCNLAPRSGPMISISRICPRLLHILPAL